VVLPEKGDEPGGTTAKPSGGVLGPNDRHMRELGLADPREPALRYMARTARPHLYAPALPCLGLPDWEFELLELFYDQGADAFAALEEIGALRTLPLADLPDYYPEIDEGQTTIGRSLCPGTLEGGPGEGTDMVDQLVAALQVRQGRLLVHQRVVGVFVDDDRRRVEGALVEDHGRSHAVRAAGAVVF